MWTRSALAVFFLWCWTACGAGDELRGKQSDTAGSSGGPTAGSPNGPFGGTGGARPVVTGGATSGGTQSTGGTFSPGAGGIGGAGGRAPSLSGGVTSGGMSGMSSAGGGRLGNAGGGAGGSAADTSSGGAATAGAGGTKSAPLSLTIFDEVVFYDAYANVVSDPVPAGVVRLRNDLFTRRLTPEELGVIQSTLRVRVVIGALCDNYDRIGSVALALVPKGLETYVADDVERIEVGRYITPFMDKNRQPDEVAYDFEADNLVPVLKDAALLARFDLWVELELFGVPYAANEEVAGCANRNDVFRGTLILDSDGSRAAPVFDELIPVAYKAPFNNYQAGASDTRGATRKTLEFVLDTETRDAQLVLITSNHGASSGGEEYVRRDHFVYVDGERKLEYKPGRKSCEPFRKVNTQGNGIYGTSPRSDSEWQSFSNWCPGDRIDTRVIPLGPMSAGSHEFVIDVPDAEFMGADGNFPLSLYVQSSRN